MVVSNALNASQWGRKKIVFQVGAAFGLVDSQFSHKGMRYI